MMAIYWYVTYETSWFSSRTYNTIKKRKQGVFSGSFVEMISALDEISNTYMYDWTLIDKTEIKEDEYIGLKHIGDINFKKHELVSQREYWRRNELDKKNKEAAALSSYEKKPWWVRLFIVHPETKKQRREQRDVW